jgi:pimeloyl-ACP methyl ester carboxylesterase
MMTLGDTATGVGFLLTSLAAGSWAAARFILSGGRQVPLTARPEQFGLRSETVEFTTNDGVDLRGWFIPAVPASERTLLFCHGWGTNKGEILRNTHGLCRRGFNLFYFDFRHCGESGGENSSVGTLEARDFDAAARFIRARRPQDLFGLYGLSMGAMVAFCGLDRHRYFKAAVIESPFASHSQAIERYTAVKTGLRRNPLVPLVLFWMRRSLGVDPDASSPERLAGRIAVPLLVICGGQDRAASVEIGQSLVAKAAGPASLWVIPGADHTRCAESAGNVYEDKLTAFYESWLVRVSAR